MKRGSCIPRNHLRRLFSTSPSQLKGLLLFLYSLTFSVKNPIDQLVAAYSGSSETFGNSDSEQSTNSDQSGDADDKISVVISVSIPSPIADNPPSTAKFSIRVSPAQAALYVYLSDLGKLKILPSSSFGSVKQVEELSNFFLAMINPGYLTSQITKANKDKAEDDQQSQEDFIAKTINTVAESSFSFAVSLTGDDVKGSVLMGEVKACLSFYHRLKVLEVGFYGKLVPGLRSTQVLNLIDAFMGEINGYFTAKRSLPKLLFEHYAVEREHALFSPFNSSVIAAIDKRKCVFDESHVVLTVDTGVASGGMPATEDFKLQVGNDKANLREHSVIKPNGKRYMVVKAVTIAGHVIKCNVKYPIPGQDRVSPLFNADAMAFRAGFVSVRLVSGKYQVEIPVTEDLLLSAAKSEQGCVNLITLILRLLDSHVHLLHRPHNAHLDPDPMMVDDPAAVAEAPAIDPMMVDDPAVVAEAPAIDPMMVDDPAVVAEAPAIDPMMVDEPAVVAETLDVEKKGSKSTDWHPEYVRFAQESPPPDVSIAEL